MESKSCIFGKCIRKLGDVFVSRIFPQVWNFIFLFQEYFLMFEILLTSGRWETTLFQIVLFTEKLALSSMECQRLSDMQITTRGLGGLQTSGLGVFLISSTSCCSVPWQLFVNLELFWQSLAKSGPTCAGSVTGFTLEKAKVQLPWIGMSILSA